MKSAESVVERVAEYNYYSASIDGLDTLSLRRLAIRLQAFYKVMAKASKAAKKAGGPTNSKKNRKRMR